MRLYPNGRLRPRQLAAGALALICLTILAAVSSAAGAATSTSVPMTIADARLKLGQALEARGTLPASDAGRTAVLEYRRAGASAWAAIATSTVGERGDYRLRGRVKTNGQARVVVRPGAVARSTGGAPAPAERQSASRRVRVASAVRHGVGRLDVVAGRVAAVRGRLAPGRAGRRVKLQGRVRGRWVTWDTARTRGDGAYRLAFRPRRVGRYATRVSFAGDAANGPARRATRPLDVFRHARATWYGPGLWGNHLGCGGRLGYGTIGVAHKTLPCGTRLTLRHRGRELRARVIDRGPYSFAEYDLTRATKRRLGFVSGSVLVTR